MKCLVLGGNGFLGRHLVAGLVSRGHGVRVFDLPETNVQQGSNNAGIEYVCGEASDRFALAGAIEGCNVVFHLISATLPKSSNDDPLFDLTANVAATLGLLDVLKDRKEVRLVFISSGGTVYGVPQHLPISEMHPTEPLSAYGVGKLAIEKYLALYEHLYGLEHRILRMANLYGEGQSPFRGQGAVAVFAYKALRDDPIEIWGDGSVVRDYFHVEDAVNACVAAISHVGRERIFNIGSGEGLSLNQLLGAIQSELGRPVSRLYHPSRKFDVPANVLDCSRARTALGWSPGIPFSAGLARTIAWLRSYS